MGLNRDFIGQELGPEVHTIDKYNVIAFADAIGAAEMNYINNSKDYPAPPTYPVSYELPLIYKLLADTGLHGSEEQYKKNMLMLVHGEQRMKFHRPLLAGDKITYRAKIIDIEDRGSGEVIKIKVLSTFGNGAEMVESDWGLFVRGIGSGRRPIIKNETPKEILDPENADLKKHIKVPLDITYKYSKASNDMNPIHLNNEVAKKAGLRGIVVHGLCTMSMTMQKIVEERLNSDYSNLLSIAVRFSAPVYPGDELEVFGWEEGTHRNEKLLKFEVSRLSDGIRVIKDGRAEIAL